MLFRSKEFRRVSSDLDNPVTKEALCYGAVSASVFASVIIWCCCVSIASSDAEEKAYLPAAARIYADMCDMKTVAGDKGPKSVTGIPLDIVEERRWLRQRIIAGAGARVGSASLSISPDRKNTLEYRTDVFEPGYGESIDSHEDKKSDIRHECSAGGSVVAFWYGLESNSLRLYAC